MAEEIPGHNANAPRPMIDIRTNNTFDDMVKSNYGKAPKRSKLSEFLIGHMTQHVYDSEFNTITGADSKNDYV
jgi:hypothetical protein